MYSTLSRGLLLRFNGRARRIVRHRHCVASDVIPWAEANPTCCRTSQETQLRCRTVPPSAPERKRCPWPCKPRSRAKNHPYKGREIHARQFAPLRAFAALGLMLAPEVTDIPRHQEETQR